MYSDLHLSIHIFPLRTTSHVANRKPGPAGAATGAGQADGPPNRPGLIQAPSVPGSVGSSAAQALLGRCAPVLLPSLYHTQPPDSRPSVSRVQRRKKTPYCWHFVCIITLRTKSRNASFSLLQNFFYPGQLRMCSSPLFLLTSFWTWDHSPGMIHSLPKNPHFLSFTFEHKKCCQPKVVSTYTCTKARSESTPQKSLWRDLEVLFRKKTTLDRMWLQLFSKEESPFTWAFSPIFHFSEDCRSHFITLSNLLSHNYNLSTGSGWQGGGEQP